jgi:O-antigen/teichoic acid export membrane protein
MLASFYPTAKRFAPAFLIPYFARAEKSAFGRRMVSGVFWSAFGAVISRALALVAGIIAAQILGKVAFGELGVLQSTISMFATFATFGVGLTATKHVAEYRKTNPARAGRIVVICELVALVSAVAIAVLMVVTAPSVATRFLGAPHLTGLIALGALALVFTVLNEAQVGTLSGLEAFRRRSSIQIVAGIASFPITVTAVWFFGLTGAVWGMVISTALLVVLSWHAIRAELRNAGIPIQYRDIGSELGVIWRFNFPTLCCGAVYIPAMWVANLILVNGQAGYSEMGIFSAADRWRTAIMFLPTLIGGVTLPLLSGLGANPQQFKKVLWTNVATSFGLSVAVAAPIALFSPWIMKSYGREFTEGYWTLVTLCGAAIVHAAYWIVGQSIVSRGRVWTMFRLNVAWATVLLTVSWLTRTHGAQGLALGYLCAELLRLTAGIFVATRPTPVTSGSAS